MLGEEEARGHDQPGEQGRDAQTNPAQEHVSKSDTGQVWKLLAKHGPARMTGCLMLNISVKGVDKLMADARAATTTLGG